MSKRVRNLVILVSVSAVVIGGLLALVFFGGGQTEDPSGQGQNKPNVQAVDPDIPILNHQAAGSAIVAQNIDVSNVVSNVATVTITNELDSFTVSPREVDGNMSVEAYHDMLRDADAIDLMCKHLTYLTAVAKPEKQEDMAAYGFDAPKATVEITYKDDETAAFEIGIESKGTEGYYCRLVEDETETLYIVSKTIAEQFTRHGKDYIGKGLIASPAPKVDDETGTPSLFNMILTGSCREQAIVLDTDTDASYPSFTYASTMYMKVPYLRMIDSDAFYNVSSMMLSLTASGVEMPYPTDEQLAEYGISKDTPYSAVNFALAVTEASASESGSGTVVSHYGEKENEHVIILGNKNEDGYYYALVDNYNAVYLLAPSSVPWAELQYLDVVGKNIFIKDITTVDTMTMTVNGTATTFTLTHDTANEVFENRLKVHAGKQEYSSDDYRTLYETLLRVKRVAATDADAVAGDVVFRLQLTFNDGNAPLDYTVYTMSGSRHMLVTNDGEQIALSAKDVSDFLKQYENFLAGLRVDSPY